MCALQQHNTLWNNVLDVVVILPEAIHVAGARPFSRPVPRHNEQRPADHRTNRLQMHVHEPPPLYSLDIPLVEHKKTSTGKPCGYVHVTGQFRIGQPACTTAATTCVAFPFSAVAIRIADIHKIIYRNILKFVNFLCISNLGMIRFQQVQQIVLCVQIAQ